MIVVSDTSCITNLLTIGLADLLPRLFGQVVIPSAVAAELRVWHSEVPSFLIVKSPSDKEKYLMLRMSLGAGEAEAICLALEMRPDLLLMDERRGRRIAANENISTVGLLGVLVRAKKSGLITQVSPIIERLEFEAGFRVSPHLKKQVLQNANES